jgi:hypothetical protein
MKALLKVLWERDIICIATGTALYLDRRDDTGVRVHCTRDHLGRHPGEIVVSHELDEGRARETPTSSCVGL